MISNWTNLLSRRDLLRELIATELKASTAQTKLGWLWWLLDPLLMMVIYWVIVVELFGRGQESYAPYWIFIFFGLLTWKHLTSACTKASVVLNSRKGLIQSVAFPTMVLPLSISVSTFAFFLFGFAVIVPMSLIAPMEKHTGELLPVIQVPFLMAFQLLIVAGVALPISCLGVVYRDFTGLVPHIMRLGFYLSPGLFGSDLVRDGLVSRFGNGAGTALFHAYMLNPFAILIDGYRDAMFYGRFIAPGYWVQLVVEAALLVYLGYWVYQRYDRRVIKFL